MEKIKPSIHYTASYLIDPQHPVTINVIGTGGTGSQVLNSLARMNSALKALGHPGIFVRAIDPDRVTNANMGRQLFSSADVNDYKCNILISRINRFFGTDWESIPALYNAKCPKANITISCVDSGKARKEIYGIMSAPIKKKEIQYAHVTHYETRQPYEIPYYWMDFGNTQDRGQVVIGTLQKIKQPVSKEFTTKEKLKCIHDIHKDIFIDKKGDDQGPSCSLAEALQKQDLFINTNLANMGLAILWKMFREARITHNGLYINLQNLTTNPIPVV